MATSKSYIEFVCDQIDGVGEVTFKKMFGEYTVYACGKPVLFVCDDTVFVKILPELESEMKNAEKGFPYNGAKEHYILDIENSELSRRVVGILERITPLPKKKAKKKDEKNAL